MAIIYGNAISIGYATSGSTVGGTYSIWLTIPTVATTTTFTAVKDGVSVDSKYISSIGAAKITLPEDNPEGDWTITGTVGGKTASKTVTVKSSTVDYFIDFRNDFIPLVGELKVGNLVTFDNKEWRVVHQDQEGTHWYLAAEEIYSLTSFGSNKRYYGSTIAGVAATYESEQLSETAKEYCLDVTVNNVTNKVFVPSYEQVNGGFSYYNSNANQICNYKGNKYSWWTSSPSSNDSIFVYYVSNSGGVGHAAPDNSYGFRPHICINFNNSGLDFTYTGEYNVRTDGVVELLTSGELMFNETQKIDIFCVGGGGKGGYMANPSIPTGAGGGGGGYTKTLKNYDILGGVIVTIGDGSTNFSTTSSIQYGETTSFGSILSAAGGQSAYHTASGEGTNAINGGNGGSGGGSGASTGATVAANGGSDGSNGNVGIINNYSPKAGTGQGTTTREFGEATGKLYAGGGGGGITSNTLEVSSGGLGGGGNGARFGSNGSATTIKAINGKPNTGGGGGGGARYGENGATSGDGGSGIVCIRKAKPQSTDIPLTGDLAIGNTVTFDDKSFLVVHNEGTKWYLANSTIVEECTSTVLTTKCTEYLSNFSSTAQNYMVAQTIDSYTGKVFLPSRTQLNSGFSYYKNNANRICRYKGEASYWWALTSSSSGYNDSVDSDGAISSNHYSVTLGFRPHICIDISLSGETVTLAGTWLLNDTLYPTEAKLTEKIDVTHAGSKYTSIVIDPVSNRDVSLNAGVGGKTLYYFDTKRWNGSDHTITFSEGATCSDVFFTWLKANATKQS